MSKIIRPFNEKNDKKGSPPFLKKNLFCAQPQVFRFPPMVGANKWAPPEKGSESCRKRKLFLGWVFRPVKSTKPPPPPPPETKGKGVGIWWSSTVGMKALLKNKTHPSPKPQSPSQRKIFWVPNPFPPKPPCARGEKVGKFGFTPFERVNNSWVQNPKRREKVFLCGWGKLKRPACK